MEPKKQTNNAQAKKKNPSPRQSNPPKKSALRRILFNPVVGMAVLSFALYHIFAFAYVIHRLTDAAAGPFGKTMAVNDELSAKYPFHTILLQNMVLMPIPNSAAERYYEQHHEFFLEAARQFQLHPYWSKHNYATTDMTFREVVTARIHSMYQQFKDDGRMDYRLEKDRCAQFEFLRRNGVAHPAVRKTWYSKEQVLADVASGAAVADMDDYPIFFKACHLTQRSSLGTFPVASEDKFVQRKQDLVDWIEAKWTYRSQDVDRPWQAEGDAITDALTPAIIAQEPMKETITSANNSSSFEIDGRMALGLVEIKVEVMWGKVYLMQIDGCTVILRNGDIEDYTTFVGGVLHRPSTTPNPRTSWIREGGYLDCVIATAERVAQAAHIDYIRVDVFLDRGNPDNCAVNEVSLSSGYSYFGHEKYMAKLWAEPLQRKLYQPFGYSTPVYELSSSSATEEE